MFIVHGFHNYYPFVGGMERVVQGIAEAQAMLGHEVHVITSNYGALSNPDKEVLNNVHIHRLKSYRFHYPDLTIPRRIPLDLLKNADIVHVHAHNSLFSQRILDQTNKLGVKNACYFMGVNALQGHPNSFIRLFAPYYGKQSTIKALKLTNLILVKSMRDLNILKKIYGVEATYLPDAIPVSTFISKKENSDTFRAKFGIRQDKFFLFIGRMHKLKGPHILVNALKYVDKDFAAVFIGPDGGYLRETVNLAEKLGVRDRTYILGYVDEATKLAAIDSAVALVNPSIADHVEVYSIVLSEAWAREKPVIASRVGEVAYRVKQRVNGILVEPSNPKMLAEAMLELVGNDKLAEEMGKNGKADVFSWKTIALKSLELYRRVLENKVSSMSYDETSVCSDDE